MKIECPNCRTRLDYSLIEKNGLHVLSCCRPTPLDPVGEGCGEDFVIYLTITKIARITVMRPPEGDHVEEREL